VPRRHLRHVRRYLDRAVVAQCLSCAIMSAVILHQANCRPSLIWARK
jgi:hypothetical protein